MKAKTRTECSKRRGIKLLTMVIPCILSGTAWAGGASTGGTPPAMTLNLEPAEFDQLSLDLFEHQTVALEGETLVPDHIDLPARVIELYKEAAPESRVTILDRSHPRATEYLH